MSADRAPAPAPAWRAHVRDACAFCARPRNLRRTVRIALVVGVVLTGINQGAIIAGGDATTLTAGPAESR